MSKDKLTTLTGLEGLQFLRPLFVQCLRKNKPSYAFYISMWLNRFCFFIIVDKLEHLLVNNKIWSEKVKQERPTFFTELALQQSPEYVWIGCSDSRVSASDIVGLLSGEVFVHRNIANLVNHTDMNCLSVIQFAVEVLKVKHIIVCGHYGCGGVLAALENKRHGLIDNWLRHIQDTANLYDEYLTQFESDEKLDKLCELNIVEQVLNVSETTIVQDAWERGQNLTVHGWIYSIGDGIIKNLDVSLENRIELKTLRKMLFTNFASASKSKPPCVSGQVSISTEDGSNLIDPPSNGRRF